MGRRSARPTPISDASAVSAGPTHWGNVAGSGDEMQIAGPTFEGTSGGSGFPRSMPASRCIFEALRLDPFPNFGLLPTLLAVLLDKFLGFVAGDIVWILLWWRFHEIGRWRQQ